MALTRSQQMSRIRQKHTSPETLLRAELWKRGLRYRLHAKTPSGRPDIVFSSKRVAVFIDGCFWHGCPEHYVRPRTKNEFWAAKILRLHQNPFQFGAFTLLFQPVYEEIWRAEGPRVGSFSRPMQPDITLSVASDHPGEPHPVIVLDAKYRIDTGLNEAIGSIHTYRDALVEQVGAVEGASHRRTVKAAFLLSPQSFEGPEVKPWRSERAPAVFFREGYREAFRFGAVSMKPGMTIDQCRDLLVKLLEACDSGASVGS